MWVIAGLGNPGTRYQETRHNIGFKVIDALAERWRLTGWKDQDKSLQNDCVIADCGRVFLIKPQDFMNRSGGPICRLANFYKVGPENLIVVHDEVDLAFGSIRLKTGGGDGGHNGIKSIVAASGTADFKRVRVGVGRPVRETEGSQELSDWVLGGFSKEERDVLTAFIERSADAVEMLMREGLKKAQNVFNS